MKKIFFFSLIFFLAAESASPQLFKRKINQYKNGLRSGLWITYSDSTGKQLEQKGRFKEGHEKGTWKYYSDNGTIRRKEKFRRKKIITTTYYPEGVKQSKGVAVIVLEDIYLHYYYTGPWKYFTKAGKLEKIVVYDKGTEVSSTEIVR